MAKAEKITVDDLQEKYLDKILKQFGDAIVQEDAVVEAISTGSLALDASIGIGGVPRGRFTEIYGPEGSAKTTIGLTMSMNVIENGGRVLYIDAELMLSYDTIKLMLGKAMDPSKFILLHPETAEEALMVAETLMESGDIDLVVVDTVAAMEPKAERAKELDEFTVGEISRLLPKFFRKDSILVKKSNVAFVFLNQVRDKVGSYVQGYNSPGGHALKHHCSVIIALTKGETTKIGTEAVGIKAKFVIRKNKLAPPFRSFTIPVTFGKGIDYHVDVLEFCEMLGVVQKAGSYYKFNDNTIGQGRFAAAEFLEGNPDILKQIIDQTYAILSKDKSVIIEDTEDDFAESSEETVSV